MSDEAIIQAAQMIMSSTSTVVLTGAGVSTKSGIPDFRSPDGLWSKVDPAKFASVSGFLRDPKGWWETALDLAPTLMNAKPNSAHKMLAKLEKMGFIDCIVTQNVDGLHQRAGSKNVLEVHGSLFSATCTVCLERVDRKYLERAIKKRQIPVMCPTCGGLIKLDTVFFGEPLPQTVLREAVNSTRKSQLLLAIGSYLVVYPIATLPTIAKQSGAGLIIINLEPTPYDTVADLVFHAEAGETLTEIVNTIQLLRKKR
jgi:NAD-dependent deacetylase